LSLRCAYCGSEDVTGHHITGRDTQLQYLDPRLTVPLCHDHHYLAHDDLRVAGVDDPAAGTSPRLPFVERVELRLRRLAVALGRLAPRSPIGRGLVGWRLARSDGRTSLHAIFVSAISATRGGEAIRVTTSQRREPFYSSSKNEGTTSTSSTWRIVVRTPSWYCLSRSQSLSPSIRSIVGAPSRVASVFASAVNVPVVMSSP